MSDITLSFQEPEGDTDFQAAIQKIHLEISHLNQKMSDDRQMIDRLKTETDLLKVETRAILASLKVAV